MTCVLVVVAMGFSGLASADMVVYDGFADLSVTQGLWGNYQSGIWPTVSGGNLTIAGRDTGNNWSELGSNNTFKASVNTFEWKYMGGAGDQLFGIYFNGYDTGYTVENRTGAAGGWRINNGLYPSVPEALGSYFSLAAGNIVRIAKNGGNFDASVNGTVVSSVAANPASTGLANLWFGTRPAGSTESFDYVSVGTQTPEPSSLIVMSAGVFGLLAYAWRKRR
jgi:hypothetical protein